MDKIDLAKASRANLAREIATRTTDPKFFSALTVLPNPDTVLRKLGRSEEVFDGLAADAHVVGDLRSIRSGLLGFEWRVQAGGYSNSDVQAFALCEQLMAQRPAPGMRWPDVIWNMAGAVFRGFRVHEVVWARQGQYLMPEAVLDKPNRRFAFGSDSNELRLLTRENQISGLELGAYKWLMTRHMPSHENPYGVAVFSSCFWPWTFKNSGYRYFVKFCEKYGIPWAIGRYPLGTPKPEQDALANALARMIEDAVAAIPEGGLVELVENKGGGQQLPQERLISLCNREISKALTSQTLATEIQGNGSRAASETHRGREEAVNESDRTVISDAMNELFAWITELNVPGAVPPTFEFYEEAEARKDWVEVLDKARAFVQVPVQFAHERLQIPAPVDGEAVLPGFGESKPPAAPSFEAFSRGGFDFAKGVDDDFTAMEAVNLDKELGPIAEAMLKPLFDEVREGVDPEALMSRLEALFPKMDFEQLTDLLARVIFVGELYGRLQAQQRAAAADE